MKPYSEKSICSKCGHDVIETRYCGPGANRYDMARCLVDGEHLHRTCKRCGYEWLEAPLDAKVTTDGPLYTSRASHPKGFVTCRTLGVDVSTGEHYEGSVLSEDDDRVRHYLLHEATPLEIEEALAQAKEGEDGLCCG